MTPGSAFYEYYAQGWQDRQRGRYCNPFTQQDARDAYYRGWFDCDRIS